jgi:hypothetical protein
MHPKRSEIVYSAGTEGTLICWDFVTGCELSRVDLSQTISADIQRKNPSITVAQLSVSANGEFMFVVCEE